MQNLIVREGQPDDAALTAETGIGIRLSAGEFVLTEAQEQAKSFFYIFTGTS